MKKPLLFLILLAALFATRMAFGQKIQSQPLSYYSFISSGNWNDGSHWNTGEVPPEGSDVIIEADAVIPAGYTAITNQVSIQGGSITVADGGQLMHNTQGLMVTMEKSIAAFNEVNSWSNYYLLAFPFSEDVAVPATMTAAENNDFYTFDPDYPDAEWRNNKQNSITTVGGTMGYLYANSEDIELSLTGSTYQSYGESAITVEVPYTEGSSNVFNGWALLGNPYTCNAYVYAFENGACVPKEFMVYNAEGELVRCSCSSIAPMQGFFVKVGETTTICIKTTSPYVDLGLPSGTLWATCNVGADAPEDYGDYFAWGEIQPKSKYDWNSYLYCIDSYNTLTKYCSNSIKGYNGFTDELTVLLPEDDAATANWGIDWRIPTKVEWEELYNNTSFTWTTQNGVKGLLFTAPNGNSLFLPATGFRQENNLKYAGSHGWYWSSSLDVDDPSSTWDCGFYLGSSAMYYDSRFYGQSVRPVHTMSPSLFIISTIANPTLGGTLSGGGNYPEGAECIVTATANDGYTFANWTENGIVVSNNANYNFTVMANRSLVANFTYNGNTPTGAINGLFSVYSNRQVYFSQGNLQYKASTLTWRFATNQYDYVGNNTNGNVYENGVKCSNTNISSGYNGWIDLFGWGTSSYHNPSDYQNINYQPFSTSTSLTNFEFNYNDYGYGPSGNMNDCDLTGTSVNYDWGVYQPIINGGNTTKQWRTLSKSEWDYVFNTRSTPSGIRFTKAEVNNVNGVILLPDNWSATIYSLNNTNSFSASFSCNVVNPAQWIILENAGAVFLPAAGSRSGTSVASDGYSGSYWSTTHHLYNGAYYLYFYNSYLEPNDAYYRYYGRSVRLVRSEEKSDVTTCQVTGITHSTAICGGNVITYDGTTVTECGVCWNSSAFDYPTINDSHAIGEAGTGSFYCAITGLMSKTTYYVRAYAMTNDGISYGNIVAFTTSVDNNGGIGHGIAPIGAVEGLFSVSTDSQVYFSEGNLQYQSSSNTWRFANNQYDYIGSANSNISSSNSGWIDLFGWGTSGYHYSSDYYNTNYYPYSLSKNTVNTTYNYYGYGPSTNKCPNLTGTSANYDWGVYNLISNGGNTTNTWRTLTQSEWDYVLNTRTTASGKRYAKARVNNINGVILLPDSWSADTYQLNSVNIYNSSYSNNEISASQWTVLENAGAVFLPAAGTRSEFEISNVGSNGYYWSTSYNNHIYAYCFSFNNNDLYSNGVPPRYRGLSVRLVRSSSQSYTLPSVTTFEPTGISNTTANCGGTVTNDGGLEITARGVCWSTSHNPTVSNSHTTDGTGTGSFTSSLTGLTANTTYYVRAYATNSAGTAYGSEVSFTTLQNVTLPTVTTNQVTNITQTTTTGGGNVTNDGGATVTERGVCWSTSHNPTTNGSHANNGTGTGSYTVNMTGLTANTTYYVRAYAINSQGTSYGSEVIFTTQQVPTYTITVSASPTNGGTVTGGGTYQQGQSCTVHATANSGYTFANWTENGNEVSTNANYTFTVNANVTLVANFSTQSYTISVSASPSNGGSVLGGGNYNYGQSCTVYATANSGYTFTNWTENGNVVSTNTDYTFTVDANKTLVANFTYNGGGNAPTGAINGLFSVSATQQVYFSQGNLQYQASSNTWRFATNQYDYIGSTNSSISQTYSGWIDLFGWGTSGYNHGANCYQPWSTSQTNSDYYAYGNSSYNLYDQTGQADWGYNSISNGGNAANTWRTLTYQECQYVFNTRSTASGIRYAKAKVNNINGVILLPDNWSASTYSLNKTNTSNAIYSSNTITASQWIVLENAGAVFLPAAGYRNGASVSNIGSSGGYWSASTIYMGLSRTIAFSNNFISTEVDSNLHYGNSVRLVHDAQ